MFWQPLFGKIEIGFQAGKGLYQPLAPAFVDRAELAIELAQRLAALRFGFRINQIRQPLDGGEIELVVLERAARKLPGLGEPEARLAPERIDHRSDRGAPAVDVTLGNVLTGEARRGRAPEAQPVIERFAGNRMTATPARPAPVASAKIVSVVMAGLESPATITPRAPPSARHQPFCGPSSGWCISLSTRPPSARCVCRTSSTSSKVLQRYHTPSG